VRKQISSEVAFKNRILKLFGYKTKTEGNYMKYLSLLFSAVFIFLSNFIAAKECVEIRYLKPPKLEEKSITERDGLSVKRSVYLMPKRDPGAPFHAVGVLGGTFIENGSEANEHIEEYEIMLENAREFFGQTSVNDIE